MSPEIAKYPPWRQNCHQLGMTAPEEVTIPVFKAVHHINILEKIVQNVHRQSVPLLTRYGEKQELRGELSPNRGLDIYF